MSRPRVSTIVPTFNRAGSIRTAVESALRQTMADQEVIVVDDASHDGTADIVRSIDDPRVRLIVRGRNGGAAAARNNGVAASQGDYIAFLDSDDVWFPEKLARQLPLLETAAPSIAVACSGVEMHLLDHGITRIQPFETTDNWARRLAMACDLSPGTTLFARRVVFEDVGPLDETLPRFEDWDWLLRYSRKSCVVGVREPLARVHNRRARLGDCVAMSAKRFQMKHRTTFAALAPQDRRTALADLWLQVAGTYAFEGRFVAMLPSVLAAMRQRPMLTVGRLATAAGTVLNSHRVR